MSENENDIQKLKEVEYYSAQINGWVTSRIEFDKSLLYLSTSAFGLLVTLLIATISNISLEMVIIYFASIISFLVCIISVLLIFQHNARYIEEIMNRKKEGYDKLLGVFDKLAIISFSSGVILAFLFILMFVVKAKGGIK